MARLLGPDMGSRVVFLPTGAPAAGRVGVVYSDAAGTLLADILTYDGTETPGAGIVGAALTVDAYGLLPQMWFPDGVDRLYVRVNNGPLVPIDADNNRRLDQTLPLSGGTLTGKLVVNANSEVAGYPLGQSGAVESGLSVLSSFGGGEDDGTGTDSTGRINLYSYQRAQTKSFGENIRHFMMRGNAKSMDAWYFPSGGYDASLNPVGTMKPVVWTGAHWQANNGLSNHKHWSVETPDSTGAIQTRFEIRFGDPTVGDSIAGLDKTLIMTNLADLVVRCTNGQELRLSAAAGTEKGLMFSLDSEGADQYRRWKIRATSDTEGGSNAGTNFQLARYDDAGTFVDNPISVSRSTGNVTLGPGFIARRATASVSSVSLNTTSLGGGVGVVGFGETTTPPPSNPTGGVVLYVSGGRLKIRQPDGTNQFVALTAT